MIFVRVVTFLNFLLAFLMGAIVPVLSRVFPVNPEGLPPSYISYLLMFITLLRMTFIAQFVLVCSAIQVRFKAFNTEFVRRQKTVSTTNALKINRFDALHMGNIFQKLSDCIDIVNETFTFQLVFIFTVLLVSNFH